MKEQRGQIGLVGEYAVLSALILRSFNAARMDGNSRDIDILCSSSDFADPVKIQVKTQGPRASYSRYKQPIYSFQVAILDSYQDKYRQAILDQKIHFVFYLCPQIDEPVEPKKVDAGRAYGRFFVATPKEVVKQLDTQTQLGLQRLFFRVLPEKDDKYCVKEGGVLIKDFENRWDKLR